MVSPSGIKALSEAKGMIKLKKCNKNTIADRITFGYSRPMFLRVFFFFLILLLVNTQTRVRADDATPHWNLNDVTYVFPLPTVKGIDRSLKPGDQSLLPAAIYEKLPNPITSMTPKSQWFKDFRVMGVRIDPEASQVRMTWQITRLNDAKTAYTTEDSGIHTFYQLNASQLKTLLAGLWKLKLDGLAQTPPVNTDFLSLQMHPAFSHPQFAVEFANRLKKILLAVCSSKNMIQATLMQFGQPANGWWEFSGFHKNANGKWDPLMVPRVNDPVARFSNETTEMDPSNTFPVGMRGEIVPAPEGESLSDAIHGWHKPDESDRPVFERTFRTLRSFQNPKLTNPNTLDCVQCHLTDATRFYMNSSLKNVEKPGLADDVTFKNPDPKLYNLNNVTVSGKSTKIFRALGYWQEFTAVNQRVINETATVADYLNRAQK
jgi:hypothetical protein